MKKFPLFCLIVAAFLYFFSAPINAKSVTITSGSVEISGGQSVNNVGQPNEIFTEFNLNGRDFSFITAQQPSFTGLYLTNFFRYGLDSGENFSLDDLSFPFNNNSSMFASVNYRGMTYSRIKHSDQHVLFFNLPDDLEISDTAPYTASAPFSMNGSLILKCHQNAPAPCNGMIQRIRVNGKGTLTINLSRWTPSEGQWAWLNVRFLNFEFEE